MTHPTPAIPQRAGARRRSDISARQQLEGNPARELTCGRTPATWCFHRSPASAEGFVAVEMGRKFVGAELKQSLL